MKFYKVVIAALTGAGFFLASCQNEKQPVVNLMTGCSINSAILYDLLLRLEIRLGIPIEIFVSVHPSG